MNTESKYWRMQKEKVSFGFVSGDSHLQTEVLTFLHDLEFLSAAHLFRQLPWKASGNQPDTIVKCINQCTEPELALLTAAEPDNLSLFSAGYFRLGFFPHLCDLMDYIHFLIRKLNFQVGFHLDYLKHLVLNLFFNIAFSDCNLSIWICWSRKHLLCSWVLQVCLTLPNGFRKTLMKNVVSLDNRWGERKRSAKLIHMDLLFTRADKNNFIHC